MTDVDAQTVEVVESEGVKLNIPLLVVSLQSVKQNIVYTGGCVKSLCFGGG